MFEGKRIRDIGKVDFSYEDFKSKLSMYKKDGFKFYVGTDSQISKDEIVVVTCLCVHNRFKGGGTGFYIKNRIKRYLHPTLRSRMSMEAFNSIEAAFYFQELMDVNITVHLDIGTDPKINATAFLVPELTGMVIGQGFDVGIKPYSWACDLADKFTKN
ncbi:ribonuclease H-like YkuK family protein [bacterium]|nr:ribonuclease H-like YkuK family protein [bacterium]